MNEEFQNEEQTGAEQLAAAAAEYAAAADLLLNQNQEPGPDYSKSHSLGSEMLREFSQAMNDRILTEQRWLKDLRQYRGQYEPEEEAAIGPNRSKSFLRKTRVKVKTVNARIVDMLFPAGKEVNFKVGPTPVPSVSAMQKKQIVQQLAQAFQAEPTKQQIDQAVRDAAEKAAKGMSMRIEDQLSECRYKDVAKRVINSGNLYGTGVLKAPLVERKIRERFIEQNGRWKIVTEEYTVPFVDFVPLWRLYPDMAATTLEECRYIYERHLMTRTAMLKLAKRKSFSGQKILDWVNSNINGHFIPRYYDAELKLIGDRQATQQSNNGQFEVLERWGWLSAQKLRDAGVKVPKDREDEDFFCNIWCLPNGEVIRAAIQPINGVTWPYHFYYFDKDETSLFGEGLASIMRDDQKMLNAVVRMILDNAAITAGPMLEVMTHLLAKTEKIDEVFPFKVWMRNREDPGTSAVRVIDLPSNLEELTALFQLFDNNADEVSVVPKYTSGENPRDGAAGTASGLSMLMAAQGVAIKDLIVSFDEGITKPFIQALYRWNMQFTKDNSIKGDFNVVALGASSLMAKEIRAQQLDQFSATLAPEDAQFVKRHQLITQRAEAHDLTDIVKTQEEVDAENNSPQAQQAAQMQQMQMDLQMKQMQATVAKLSAEVSRILADAARIDADAINKRIDGAYTAMQAGGAAIQSPQVAEAGDELLRASGWQDKTAPDVNGAPQPAQVPQQGQIPLMPGPDVGMQAGMRSQSIADNVPA